MGDIVELFEEGFVAECPHCGGDQWFIRMGTREDNEADYESGLDWLLNVVSIECAECRSEFDIEHGDLIIAEKEN